MALHCVKYLYSHLIEATILTGCAKDKDVFIPRIPLMATDLPFNFKRIQFAVCIAFAMSINKTQGQSLKIAGINLQNPCFSHGQLYVSYSRVGQTSHSGFWRENKEYCTSHSTSVTLRAEHNDPIPLFLQQYIPCTEDAVPLNVHISALSRNPGAFCRQHGVYFTVTHFHKFCSHFPPHIRK
jgi:hypothetical protein